MFAVIFPLLFCAGTSFGAAVILNEYNAVSGSSYLNGGTAEQDVDGEVVAADEPVNTILLVSLEPCGWRRGGSEGVVAIYTG